MLKVSLAIFGDTVIQTHVRDHRELGRLFDLNAQPIYNKLRDAAAFNPLEQKVQAEFTVLNVDEAAP